jgi:uncharacterized protein YdhG (YjbR/CyaY superfamily)
MSTNPRAPKSTKGATAPVRKAKGLSDAEKAAMKDRIQELKADKTDGETTLLAAIAKMSQPDKTMATRVHAIVKAAAPELAPRTWYGMPAYAKDDKVVCFYKAGEKFKARYATFGFSDKANLDDGDMWPTDFALKQLSPAVEARITALVKKAVT